MNIVLFGGPGSGKGTQSEYLIKEYGLFHISTGDVLRAQIAAGTDLGKTAQNYISQGQLIPDELMIDILDNVLASNDISNGVIFDGFPRTIPQAIALNALMQKRNSQVDAVVGLEVSDDVLTERLLNRGKVSGRSDDNAETIAKRLAVYHSQTTPLKEYYINEGKYLRIDGVGTIEDIFSSIKKHLVK